MKLKQLAITLLFLLTAFAPSYAQNGEIKEMLKEKYNRRLSTLTTARDSLRVLYYLFDLSKRDDQKKIAWQIYETAGRAQDLNAQMDMLRNLAVFNNTKDTVINKLQHLADQIPNPEARAATKTFIFNQQVNFRTGVLEDEKKLSDILLDSIINAHNLKGHDVYDRIALLYQIIQYIGTEAEGSLFDEYMDKYAKLIDQLPDSDYPLKNQFYTTGAIFHSRLNGDQRRAVLYDRKLLEIMDMLKEMYTKKGRKYRNYDTNKFTSYRRMLSNFNVLSSQEIEAIHDSLLALGARNHDVKLMLEKYGHMFAYYHFARKEYDEAIPRIKKALEAGNISVYQRMKFNDMLMTASKATGDQADYVKAMEDYIKDSKRLDSLRAVTIQRELMIRNSISNAPLLQTEDDKGKKVYRNTNDTPMIVISCILAVMLIIYMAMYIRLKKKK